MSDPTAPRDPGVDGVSNTVHPRMLFRSPSAPERPPPLHAGAPRRPRTAPLPSRSPSPSHDRETTPARIAPAMATGSRQGAEQSSCLPAFSSATARWVAANDRGGRGRRSAALGVIPSSTTWTPCATRRRLLPAPLKVRVSVLLFRAYKYNTA